MNTLETRVLRELHTVLLENIDPLYLRSYLYQEGVLSRYEFIALEKDNIKSRRTEMFLLDIARKCSFEVFLNSLAYNNTYTFLCDMMKERLEYITHETSPKVLMVDSASNIEQDSAVVILYHAFLLRSFYNFEVEQTLKLANTVVTCLSTTVNSAKYDNCLIAEMCYMSKLIPYRTLHENGFIWNEEHFEKTLAYLSEISYRTSNPIAYGYLTNAFICQHIAYNNDDPKALSMAEDLLEYVKKTRPSRFSGILVATYIKVHSHFLATGFIRSDHKVVDLILNTLRVYGSADVKDALKTYFQLSGKYLKLVLNFMAVGITYNKGPIESFVYNESTLPIVEKGLSSIGHSCNWQSLEWYWKIAFFLAKAKLYKLSNREKQSDSFKEYSLYLSANYCFDESKISLVKRFIVH